MTTNTITNSGNARPAHLTDLGRSSAQSDKPGMLKRIWIKVSSIFRTVFFMVFFWKKPPIALTEKQIKLIGTLKANPARHPLPRSSRQIYPSYTIPSPPAANAPVDPTAGWDNKFDNSLERFRAVVKNTAGAGSDIVYDGIIDKHVKEFQRQVKDIPDLMNFAANVIIQIGNKASTNLFKKRDGQRSPMIDPYVKSLMASWLRSVDRATLRDTLETQLRDRISHMNPPLALPPDQNLEQYSLPIIDEFFSASLANTPLRVEELFYAVNFSPDQRTIDLVFETAARLLVENKIRQSLNIINDTLQNDLSQIVKKSFNINAKKISDIIFCRIAELISNMEYKETFDKIIASVNLQAEGYISSETIVEDLIAKAKLPDSAKAPAEEKERLQRCREAMASMGEEQYKERKILQAFSMERACHPIIQNMMCQPASDHPALEDNVFSDIADQFIRLILPKKRISIDGRPHEIDGIAHLWQQLVVPQELLAIFDHYKDLLMETFTQQTGSALATLKHPVSKFIENIFVSYVQEELKSQFRVHLRGIIQQVINPHSFKQFAAMNVLPMIFEMIVPVYAEYLITADIEGLAPKFKQTIDDRANAHATENAILSDLYALFKSKSSLFKNAQPPIDEMKFRQEILPLIQDMKRVLLICRTNDDKDNQDIAEKLHPLFFSAAKSACQLYGGGSKKPDNEAYAVMYKFIDSLSSQLGNIDPSKKEIVVNILKGKSKAILTKIKEIAKTSEDPAIYSMITAPVMDEIKAHLHQKTISLQTIKAQIMHYSEAVKVPNAPPIYGGLALNMVFGLGKFEVGGLGGYFAHWEMVKSSIKQTASEAILGGLARVRESHEIPVNAIADKLGEILINRDRLQGLLMQAGVQTPGPDPEVVNATYNARIGHIATLAHDIVNQAIDLQFSSINPMRGMIKSAVGHDSSKINKMCTNLFDRLFKDKLLIENLVFRIQDTILQSLHEADAKLRRQNALSAANYMITNPLVA